MKRASVGSQLLLSVSVAISAIALTTQSLRAETVDTSSSPPRFEQAVRSSSQPTLASESRTSGTYNQPEDPTGLPDLSELSDPSISRAATDLLSSPTATVTTPSVLSPSVPLDVPVAVSATEAISAITFTALPNSAADSATSPNTTTSVSDPGLPEAATSAFSASELPRSVSSEFQIAQDSEPLLVENEEIRYRLGYIGVGANLGLTGDGALADEGFAVFSKIPLSSNLSLRPGVIFTGDVGILLPVTYDFQIGGGDLPRALPYLGTGISISTGDDSEVDFLVTGGVDIPLSRQFTATAGLNVAPFNSFDLGILLGIAYNFEARTVRTPIASVNPEFFGQDARSNPSFLGAGINLGIGGDSALGDSSFAVLSKIALGSDLSVRPTLLIENDVTFLIPVTYDFERITTEYLTLAPYAGGGLSFSSGDDSNFDLLLSAGFDIPITRNLAATTGVNITPFDSFDIGIQAGLVLTFGRY